MKKLARTDLLVWDDLGLAKLTAPQRREMLDVIEDRHERRSTLMACHLPVEPWHKVIGEPTHTDAFLDQPLHNAYRIELKGESMRKINARGAGKPDRRVFPPDNLLLVLPFHAERRVGGDRDEKVSRTPCWTC